MEHLEFVNKINELGIGLVSTNIIDKEKIYAVPYGLRGAHVSVKNFEVKYIDKRDHDAFERLVKKCIDLDSWKHSWHKEMTPENYECFRDIIQNKIIDRAEEVEMLITTYFVLGKKIVEHQQYLDELIKSATEVKEVES